MPMEDRKDHLWKVAQEAEERIEDLMKAGSNPVGLDVGTSKVVAAKRKGKEIDTGAQLNAFIPVPYSRFTETILGQNEISYYREGDELIIYGTATEKFANMFNANVRRPMADGLINPKERPAMPVLEAILQTLVPKARAQGEVLAFSVPAAGEGHEAQLTYHEATLRRHFESLGYRPVAINEGLHMQGVLVVPPRSWLRVPVVEHFRTQMALYVRPDRPLTTMDVRPIDRTPNVVVDYVLKSVSRRRYSMDDVLVLPRARAEVVEGWRGPDRAA